MIYRRAGLMVRSRSSCSKNMDQKIPYDDYQLPVVFLPSYESPPAWIPPQERIHHPDYNNELTQFLPRSVVLKKPPGAQLGFNIRGGKASQLGIFISKVVPDSDAHRAGLQEGDQVLSVNDVDFQDIEHSKAVEILKTAREILMNVRYFPYSEYYIHLSLKTVIQLISSVVLIQ
uniref:PDZ domain-containing protein 11 n=1 Tax=Cyprinus carpio TaxID=7962 RepID=A0A8C1YP41_CYPCA